MQKRRIIIVVIAGLLIIAILFTLINLSEIKKRGFGGFISELFSPKGEMHLAADVISIEEQKALACDVIGNNTIIYAGNQGVSAMNFKGEWLWDETSVNFLNPYIKTAGEYILVVELEGKHALLFKNNTLIWKNEFSDGIISADLSSDGYAVIAHNIEVYSGAVTVFKPSSSDNKTGDILFTTKLSGEKIINCIISENSEQMLISTISTEGEIITGGFTFVDMSSGNSYASVKTEREIYPICSYINGDTVVAVNSGSMKLIKRSLTSDTGADFNNEVWNEKNGEIYAAGTNKNKLAVAGGNDESGVYSNNPETKIYIMGTGGNIENTLDFSGSIKKIECEDNIISVNTSNKISFYDFSGNKLYDYDISSEIRKVIIINEYNFVVITNKDIHVLKAKTYRE